MRLDILKPSVIKFTSSLNKGEIVTEIFKCTECGFHSCYRPKKQYQHTFFEGHFYCIKCKKEANYASDDWTRLETPKFEQLQLF